MIETQDLTNYSGASRRQFTLNNGVLQWGAVVADLSFYGNSLATAVSSIGATETILNVSESVTLAGNVTVPKNITLRFTANGLINRNGHTLTVSSFQDPGSRKVFTGTGSTVFGNSSYRYMNLAWWAGNADTADVTSAINEAIASAASAGGICGIYIPQVSPESTGAHIINTHSVYIWGNGVSTSGSDGLGTSLRVKSGSTPAYMFKIAAGKNSIHFKDFVIDANGSTTTDGILVEGTEVSGQTVANVGLENIVFDGLRYGFNHNSVSGQHQLAQTIFMNVGFNTCATAGLRTNSVNEQITFINGSFAVGAGKVGYQCDGGGAVKFIGTEFAGGGSTSKVCVVSASHGGLTFDGCQDENFGTCLQNDAADFSGIINFVNGCLIQSKMLLNEPCSLNIDKCNLMSYALQGAPSGGYVSVKRCYIRELSVNDGSTVVSPAVLSSMTGSAIVDHQLPTLNKYVQQTRQTFFSPKALDGNAALHQVVIGHYTEVSESKSLLFMGLTDANGVPVYGYTWKRNYATGRLDLSGNQTTAIRGLDATNMDITANIFVSKSVTPAQITANQNNYVPDATNTDRQVETFFLSSDASRNITGLGIGQIDNESHYILNTGSFDIVIKHQNASSTAANRFLNSTGADITLAANEGCYIKYNSAASRWFVYKLGASAGGGGGSGDVVGPASATDNALARYDSTTGKLIQSSGAILSDVDNLTLPSASLNYVDNKSGSGIVMESYSNVFRLNAFNCNLELMRNGVEKFVIDGTGIGVFGATPVAKPTVTGSRGGNAALASLLTALQSLGWITDSSS